MYVHVLTCLFTYFEWYVIFDAIVYELRDHIYVHAFIVTRMSVASAAWWCD
jgi:hypothetical protein